MRIATSSFLAALALIPFAAHADTIDDFFYTDGTHTIQYSLPATSTTEDYPTFTNFLATSTATIDGTPGYAINAQYFVLPFTNNITAVLNLPGGTFASQLVFSGPLLDTYIAVPANNPFPYLPYNIVATFTPGTYTLRTQPIGFPSASDTFTLIITPEASPVPEPSTLALLGTGAIAILPRRKRRSTTR